MLSEVYTCEDFYGSEIQALKAVDRLTQSAFGDSTPTVCAKREMMEKLEKGEYDWAHLAHAIWPDRVREKCKSDRSLAISLSPSLTLSCRPSQSSRRSR